MRFLADENVSGLLARLLRERADDVLWASTALPSAPDHVLLDRALAAISSRDDWAGHFGVIEPGRIRMMVIPPPPSD